MPDLVENNNSEIASRCAAAEGLLISAVQSLGNTALGDPSAHVTALLGMLEDFPTLSQEMLAEKGIQIESRIANIIQWIEQLPANQSSVAGSSSASCSTRETALAAAQSACDDSLTHPIRLNIKLQLVLPRGALLFLKVSATTPQRQLVRPFAGRQNSSQV